MTTDWTAPRLAIDEDEEIAFDHVATFEELAEIETWLARPLGRE
jgi:hypothetical protein